MKSLDEILVRKNEIKARAQDFGYSDVIRIACNTTPAKTPTALGFIVTKIPGSSVSYKHRGWVLEILSKELGCQVNITVLDNVEEVDKHDVMRKSASIDDSDALCSLFGVVSLKQVQLKNAENSQAAILRHAEEYLSSKTDEKKTISDAEKLSRLALMPLPSGEEGPAKKSKHDSSNESNSNNSPNSHSGSPNTDQSNSPHKK